jgi:hypothetical protein
MKLICESATGFEVARGRSASRQTFGLSGIDRRRARRYHTLRGHVYTK